MDCQFHRLQARVDRGTDTNRTAPSADSPRLFCTVKNTKLLAGPNGWPETIDGHQLARAHYGTKQFSHMPRRESPKPSSWQCQNEPARWRVDFFQRERTKPKHPNLHTPNGPLNDHGLPLSGNGSSTHIHKTSPDNATYL